MADAAALRTRFDALARAYPPGQHGRWAARGRSDALDGWFAAAIEPAPDGVALIALGGYGRRMQLPGSDIDVLLVHDGLDAARLTELGERLWYPLWDQGWTVTPLVRTPAECLAAADGILQTARMMKVTQARHRKRLIRWRSRSAGGLPVMLRSALSFSPSCWRSRIRCGRLNAVAVWPKVPMILM